MVACCTPPLLDGEHHHAAGLSFANTELMKAAEVQGRLMEACADAGFRQTPEHGLWLGEPALAFPAQEKGWLWFSLMDVTRVALGHCQQAAQRGRGVCGAQNRFGWFST